jgi:hypothetical protein
LRESGEFLGSDFFTKTDGFERTASSEPTGLFMPTGALVLSAAGTSRLRESVIFGPMSMSLRSTFFAILSQFGGSERPPPSPFAETVIFAPSVRLGWTVALPVWLLFQASQQFATSAVFASSVSFAELRAEFPAAADQQSGGFGAAASAAVGGGLAGLSVLALLVLLFLRRRKKEPPEVVGQEPEGATEATTIDEPTDFISEYGLSDVWPRTDFHQGVE